MLWSVQEELTSSVWKSWEVALNWFLVVVVGGGMSGIETLGQKKSHTQGKRGMNMYGVFR